MTDTDRMTHAMQSPCIKCDTFARLEPYNKKVDPTNCAPEVGICPYPFEAAEYLRTRGSDER